MRFAKERELTIRAYLNKILYLCEHILHESSNEETL